MKTIFLLVPALALSALGTGCVGTGPNTQQGALSGGALGAVAGAIIGNNSRGGDALGGAIIGGAIGAIAGGTMGNSVDQQRGTIYYPEERVYRRERVRVEQPAPPPAYNEPIPASPAPNAVWIPGYWSYEGRGGYSWVHGNWEVPPPNAHAYVAAHWERQGDRDVYVPASWR